MKITYLLAAILLVPSFATQATAHVRSNETSNRAHVGSRLQGYGIEGREIVAPPWSFACTTDQGPSGCGEHVWFYGSGDSLARYMNGF